VLKDIQVHKEPEVLQVLKEAQVHKVL